jgi:transposase InsO family protein
MWDELNRWWSSRRGSVLSLPDREEALATSEPVKESEPPAEADAAELENETDRGAESVSAHPHDSGGATEQSNAPTDEPDVSDARHEVTDSFPLASELSRPAGDPPGAQCLGPDEPTDDQDADPDALAECASADDVTDDPSTAADSDTDSGLTGFALPRLAGRRRRGRRLARPEEAKAPDTDPKQRLTILDCWLRSGLPAKDFAAIVGVSKHTLYSWNKQFRRFGPAGLMPQPRRRREASRLPELTKQTILMLKETNPALGCERISAMMLRGPALPASPTTVARVLREAGYELHENPTRPHPETVRHFERARPNQLWQTDLFTFMLKRQNRRVYLVAFLDDHSRFVVSFGLHASQSAALVLEVFRAGLAAYGAPQEVLTDNGTQYVTWRGQSAFHKELTQRGIQHIVAKPRHPQTLGKVERFWGTLWREFLATTVFLDLIDARARIGLFIDWYNFQRVHSGIDGLVPADRFFQAAPEVRRALQQRVAANALEMARNGIPKPPFYLTGQLGGKPFSLHAEGERVFVTREGDQRREVDLTPPLASADSQDLPAAVCPDGSPASTEEPAANPTESNETPPPGTSPLDRYIPLPRITPEDPTDSKGGQS